MNKKEIFYDEINYIKDESFENFKSEIISLLENKNKFLEFVMQTLKEEKYI